ncbi:MAG: response regulator, partial [Gammaproteobacteria bacterium]|nr:response regulator [Gammaproteobacteria bacterium]
VTSRVRRKDGNYVWMESNTYILRNPDSGIPVEIISISRDITQRKRDADQIVRAKEDAERANRAKSDFLSSMSHELRTPMNSILGFAQLLSYDDRLDLEQKTKVVRIQRAGEHLLQLINDVLDLSRIESEKLQVQCEPTLLDELLDDCTSITSALAANRAVNLHFAHSVETRAHVNADPIRCKQALLNLITNAVKYNRSGGNVWVTCARVPDHMLRISVRDDGPGINSEKQQQLFQPFNRLGQERSDIDGTGIGLVITQKVVELMGGTLGFESRTGAGSTFWIELPEIDASAERRVPSARQRRPVQATDRFVTLCVEDNSANVELVKAVFNTFWPNATLLVALSAERGLELAQTEHVDLIMLDINLPGMDGYAALKQFRTMPHLVDTPVIALTADAMSSDVERGRAAGFTEYLTKPIQIPTLCATVNRVLVR